MDSRRNLLPRLLAGLEVGILGGLAILVWFFVLSYWNFRAPWALVNLFSASLRNSGTWTYGFTSSTWTGMAAHLFVCGLLGIFIGWVLPRPASGTTVSLSGLAFGVIVSLLVYEFVWRRYVPSLGEYVAPAAGIVVHLIFGMCLAQFPRFYLELGEPEADPAEHQPVALPPVQDDPAAKPPEPAEGE
ncbi:MAG: hypothetical protein IT167_27860, partial [Bryobacterales bacterium]|nr:hypothetical protein [Bryobacterales bacterium]